jgi:HEPN domain-containing protein
MEKDFMKKRVEEWINFAEADIKGIKKLIEDTSLSQIASFHCQQAVEKLLKAIIEDRSTKTPKIHDLGKLYGIILDIDPRINIEIDENVLSEINDVYIDTRYPPDLGLLPTGIPTKDTIERFIREIEKMHLQIKELLK